MNNSLNCIAKLTNEFSKLPGVGRKTAQRYAYKVIDMNKEEIADLINAIKEVKETVTYCDVCGNFTDTSPCKICSSRSDKIVCVVAYPKDVLTFEKIKGFTGQYHVLHGTISPLEGRKPEDLRIKELLARIAKGTIEEIVLATNTDIEGEATAMYLSKLIKPLGIKVTRLAQGLSLGSDLDYADEITLNHSFNERKEV